MNIGRVHLFFLFELGEEVYSCALIHFFSKSFDDPDPNNDMWIIEPDVDHNGYWIMSVVHVNPIIHATHLTSSPPSM